MRVNSVFVDTWGWLTLGDSQEARHVEVARFYQETEDRGVPIYTSDYVLSELLTLLFRRVSFEKAVHFVEGILASDVEGKI